MFKVQCCLCSRMQPDGLLVWGAAQDQLASDWKGFNQRVHAGESSGSLSRYFRSRSPLGCMSQLVPHRCMSPLHRWKKRKRRSFWNFGWSSPAQSAGRLCGHPSRVGLGCRVTLNPRSRRVPERERSLADESGMMDLGKSEAPTAAVIAR